MNENNKKVLTSERIRIFALGGLSEDGKNMTIIEVDDSIYILEAGIKFPEGKGSLGIEYIIQDFTYLIENQDRIAGIIITHVHDDVMGALPYLLKQIKTDVYTSPMAAKEISKLLKIERITGVKIHPIKRHDTKRIGTRKVVFFPVTHAYPGTFGVAIPTSQGYIVYSGEFIEDYDDLDDAYRGDFTTCSKLGNEGVLVLLQESKGAERNGHTSPNHRVSPRFSQVLEQYEDFTTCSKLGNEGVLVLLQESKGAERNGHTSPNHRVSPRFSQVLEQYEGHRIFISVYNQSVYRIQEILETCINYDRKMLFYTKELQQLVKNMQEMGLEIPSHLIVDPKAFTNDMKDIVIIISGQGKPLFKTISNIANNEVDGFDFCQEDVIVIASPVIAGVENEFKNMENDIYKQEGTIIVLDKEVLSMHPSKEDLKMMIFLTKPKYYIPIKGEYRLLHMNSQIALEMGYDPMHIILLDNGQVATFENQKLRSCGMELELHDTLIDGKENWDMAGVVLKDREVLSTDGVMILAIGLDAKTKKIINGPDVQTRGLIYLKDAEYITNDVAKIMEETIEEAVANKTYENLATRQEIREKVSKYLVKQTAKRPMVLPVILEINTNK